MQQPSLFDTPVAPLIYKADFMPPSEQAALKANAASQEARVMDYLKEQDLPCGASKIWLAVRSSEKEPLTSIRRALTTLEKAGLVMMSSQTETGSLDEQEHLWRAV
jgi:Fe2+ or Zn2+ uptake regulation protein